MTGCPECAPRYCASRACYCGHEFCPAYPSWLEAKRLAPVVQISQAKSRAAEQWADREEPTWLDR